MTDTTTDSDRSAESKSTSRRTFLKTTAGGAALATGISAGLFGSASAGIPTPQLGVDGNVIVDPQGNTVKLRGVNIADPKRINVTAPARGKNAEQVIDLLTSESQGWHPRVIRIPVQPGDIGEHPPGPVAEDDPAPPVPAFTQSQLDTYIENHLDPVVQQCKAQNVYCIVDYHRHWKGQPWAESTSGPINTALQEECLTFWETMAPHYAEEDHVLFEIYNEPTKPGMYGGRDRQWVQDLWGLWMDFAQPVVDEVRKHTNNHVIVGSPGWSQTPEGASMIKEFSGGNLSYSYHVYGGHSASRNQNWAGRAINYSGAQHAYEKVPVFVTEFGWQDNFPGYAPHRWIQGTTDQYGKPILDWLESSPGLNWTAWCADPIWLPAMFKRGFKAPDTTDSVGNPYEGDIPVHCENLPCQWTLRGGQDMGVLIKETLAKYRNDKIPAGTIDDEPTHTAIGTDTGTTETGTTTTETGTTTTETTTDG
ncbi:MAG: cellulase family glycosylhydrolase, partial [Halococcoides sp.]